MPPLDTRRRQSATNRSNLLSPSFFFNCLGQKLVLYFSWCLAMANPVSRQKSSVSSPQNSPHEQGSDFFSLFWSKLSQSV
ncbi:hypothetical protein BDZ91DRAFT_710299 [Kalaharituber pfeilii]|nr:hypothetical protein BDZ91DRAFT_710299 [Kalaharituber pfeilii]